jgi:hypothetical protein
MFLFTTWLYSANDRSKAQNTFSEEIMSQFEIEINDTSQRGYFNPVA